MSNELNDSKKNEVIIYRFFQLGIFFTIILLIILRIFAFQSNDNKWIWIVNYIGMGIAAINLLITKCFQLKNKANKNHNKYKPFIGFTIVVMLLIFAISIPVYMAQTTIAAQCVNDVITLLALFFSLSRDIWNSVLNLIVNRLEK